MIDLNIVELYKEHTDEIQKKYGLHRKFINDSNEQGIIAVFGNDIIKLKFYHDDGSARFSGLIIENNDQTKVDLVDLVKANNQYFGLSYSEDLDYFSFQNVDEFYQKLKLLLELHSKYLAEKEYQFKQYY